MPPSDRELMVALQQGDHEAFALLYDRHGRLLVNYFYKKIYDRHEAEDLKQEVFLRILRSCKRYRPESSFKIYLLTVARNLWIDRYRSRKAAPRTVSADLRVAGEGATVGDLIPSREQDLTACAEDREAAALVREASGRLPEAQQEVFLLVQDQGLKYREVAEVLGIPVGTVKSRMNAAVSQLRGLLGRALQ